MQFLAYFKSIDNAGMLMSEKPGDYFAIYNDYKLF